MKDGRYKLIYSYNDRGVSGKTIYNITIKNDIIFLDGKEQGHYSNYGSPLYRYEIEAPIQLNLFS